MTQGLKSRFAEAIAGDVAHQPTLLRDQIQSSRGDDMRRRRMIVGMSLAGIASMVPVVLYQTGALRHLPDPPVGNFHSDKVNGSPTAFGYGGPDAPLTILSHAVNLTLASFGPPGRTRHRRWLPVAASVLAGAQAGVAARYLFYQMPKVDKAWCPYCITDAIVHMATFALTLPETIRALRH